MGGAMLRSSVFHTVDFCTRRAWWVIVLALALAAASTVYAARHFTIKTDVTDLFPPDLPWTQRAFDYMRSFPQPDILVVIDAPTP
jgi:predicted RND superfamily exporter protein